MSAAAERQVWLKPSVAITLVVASAFSLLAFLVLSAYAPDLQLESDGGAHALSNSAVGFAGLVRLLGYDQVPVVIDRGLLARDREGGSLVIITPAVFGDPSQVAAIAPGRPRLIILPKWLTAPDPLIPGWVRKVIPIDGKAIIDNSLKTISPDATITRRNGTSPVVLSVVPDGPDFDLPHRIGAIDSLQVISGKNWVPLIEDAKGGAILARLRGTSTYVLSDPDLMNTHGLADLATARAAVGILQGLRRNDAAVLFDVTLNGFGKSPSILRAAFAPPFLGATICAIVAAALMAFHAMTRFGAPLRALEAFRSGKEALVDNCAQLIRMMRRESHMALRYAVTTRNMTARALGIPRGLNSGEIDALLDRLSRASKDTPGLRQLFDEAARAKTTADMMDIAGKLYSWRRGLTHERD
jgi:hypothetical protein